MTAELNSYENIKAKLPDGGPARSLPGINIKIK